MSASEKVGRTICLAQLGEQVWGSEAGEQGGALPSSAKGGVGEALSPGGLNSLPGFTRPRSFPGSPATLIPELREDQVRMCFEGVHSEWGEK